MGVGYEERAVDNRGEVRPREDVSLMHVGNRRGLQSLGKMLIRWCKISWKVYTGICVEMFQWEFGEMAEHVLAAAAVFRWTEGKTWGSRGKVGGTDALGVAVKRRMLRAAAFINDQCWYTSYNFRFWLWGLYFFYTTDLKLYGNVPGNKSMF